MGFYVRDYYCGTVPLTLRWTLLSPTCPDPTDPTTISPVIYSARLSPEVARFAGGGDAGYPNPDDSRPLPTWISPIARLEEDVITEADLPVLRDRLRAALGMVEAGMHALQATPEQIGQLEKAMSEAR